MFKDATKSNLTSKMFCPHESFINYHPLKHPFLKSSFALVTDLEMDSGSHVPVFL